MFLFWYRSWSASDFVPDKEYRSRAPDNCVNFRRNTDIVYAISEASGTLLLEPEGDIFPSVVYGFFGLTVFVPLLRQLTGHDGSTMLTASVLLGIMILPTVTGVAEPALKSVPTSYYEGALALGATHEKSVFGTVFPAAKSGVLAGVVLGIGRAIGETMAVIMVAGNQTWMPQGLFKGLRTMTANIVIEMGYATDLHREALIATGVVLFVFILIINLCVSALKRRAEDE